MFVLLLLSTLGRFELITFLFLLALVVGYFIGHIHRIVEITHHVYASFEDHLAVDRQVIHAKVVGDINQFEAKYAVLLTRADRTVEGWERKLRIEIARELLALRNLIHYRFTGKYPDGALLSRPAAEQASTTENQAQVKPDMLANITQAGE